MKTLIPVMVATACCVATLYLFPVKTWMTNEETPVQLPAHEFPDPNYQWVNPSSRYEIRIKNSYSDERLEVVETLEQALAYLKKYSMHHDDLFVYDLHTGRLVADCYVVGAGEGQVAID